MNSIAQTGLLGIQRALHDASHQAERITSAFSETGDGDLVTPFVSLSQDKLQFAASAKIVRVADELDKTLLDILA